MSDQGIVRLAVFYNDLVGSQSTPSYELEGGRESVQSVFDAAAAIAPSRMVKLLPALRNAGVHNGYVRAIVDGISKHLRYRFGNLNSGTGWSPQEPLPDGEELATQLLGVLEGDQTVWTARWTACHAAEACSDVLLDEEPVIRLTFLLLRLSYEVDYSNFVEEPEFGDDDERSDKLLNYGINRSRGVAAEAAIHLLNRLLEHDRPLPELLIPAVRRFASDTHPAVRVMILVQLAATAHLNPELGWSLFHRVLQEDPATPGANPPSLWRYTENLLYYQYREQFTRVRQYLNQLRSHAPVAAAQTYGRILALCCLANHVTIDELFEDLRAATGGAWKGVAQVFCTNLKLASYRATCLTGLLQMLRHDEVPAIAVDHVAFAFRKGQPGSFLSQDVALALTDVLHKSPDREHLRLSGLIEWVAVEAGRDPLSALPVIEEIATLLDQGKPVYVHPADELVAALTAVLREADDSDDPDLMLRVLTIQDTLLGLGVNEVDSLLDSAARP